jgi:LuxR family maltose regulon positive regulatory protein
VWLAQGDLQAASRWAASLEKHLSADDPYRFENELAQIAQGRVLIAQKEPSKAIGLLSHLEDAARSAGRMGRVIEILLLEALAMRETGDSEHAFLALKECLALADAEGYVRVFLDEGQPMQTLLAQWLAHANPGPMRDYVIRLLSQFDVEQPIIPAAQEKASPTGSLVEPLSERELEVLRLLRTDLNGPEIARELIVSLNTVRTHTQNIYAKLGVNNRRAAVRRAEELNLL